LSRFDKDKGVAGRLGLILALALLMAFGFTVPGTSQPARQGKGLTKKVKPTSSKLKRAPRRFKHSEHSKKKCTKCHLKGSEDAAKTRPGRKDHSSCDTCHKALFYKPSDKVEDSDKAEHEKKRNQLCQVCHLEKDPSNWKPMDNLQAYPSQVHSMRTFRVEFSHKNHVGFENSRVDDCKTCHLGGPRSQGAGAKPSHKNCNTCHNSDGGAEPTLDDCKGCHIKNEGDSVRLPYSKINDRVVKARKACRVGVVEMEYDVNGKKKRRGKFSHKDHLQFKQYDKLSCASCHENVRNSETLNDIVLFGDAKGVEIKKKICGNKKCHGGRKAAFSIKSMASCNRCHYGKSCKTPPGARPDLVGNVAGDW
jgi:hypothetical protein